MKKSERLNQELIFLSGKASFQLSDLMAEFGISKRTALRDVAELESLGLPLYAESGRYGGYRLISQKPFVPVYFTIEEVEAIFFAMKALKLLSSTPFSIPLSIFARSFWRRCLKLSKLRFPSCCP